MSKLDQLIKELCPDGVEFYDLSDIFCTKNGYTPSKKNKSYWENGTIPWIRMEDIRENGHILSDSIQHVSAEAVKGNLFPENSIIVATSATIGEHALVTVKSLANQRFTYLMLKEEWRKRFDIKFLFYYCYELDKWCLSHLNQGNFASVDMKGFASFRFPVPPIEVQREIVRILDNFTELTAELTARQQQYKYYSKYLLCHAEGAVDTPIEELGKWQGGKTPSMANPDYWNNGSIPWISSKDMKVAVLEDTQDHITNEAISNGGMKLLPAGVTAIVTRSGILKHTFPVAYVPVPCTINQDIKALIVKEDMDSRFAALAIQAFSDDIRVATKKQGGTVDSLEFGKILSFKIPVPPLDEQLRVVQTLDRFDSICNDIASGIPAEIEARQKQYEYYRDKLLTFKEKEA